MTVPLFRKVEIGVDENGLLVVSDDGGKTSKRVTVGGSLPSIENADIGDLLGVQEAGQPTFEQLLEAKSELLQGWIAEHDYSADVAWGATDDVSVIIKPESSDNIFQAEIGGGSLTSTEEPDWSSVSSIGDSISDADVTWYNAGPASAFPPTPTVWQPETSYSPGSIVWSTVPNGHLYLNYPQGGVGHTSGLLEPEFPTNGDYVSDNDGYWFDLGEIPGSKSLGWIGVEAVTGPQGEQGLQGEQGETGPTGPMGPGATYFTEELNADLVVQGDGDVHITDGDITGVIIGTNNVNEKILIATVYIVFGHDGTDTAGEDGEDIVLSSVAMLESISVFAGGAFFNTQTSVLCEALAVIQGVEYRGIYRAEDWIFTKHSDGSRFKSGLTNGDTIRFSIHHVVTVS